MTIYRDHSGDEPQQLIGVAKEIVSYIVHAFGRGTLTTTGVQYGSSGISTSTDTWKVVETKTIQPMVRGIGALGTILELEFSLTTGSVHESTSAGGVVQYNWQAKNISDTSTEDWQWLLPTSSGHSTAVGSTEVFTTYSGYMTVATHSLDEVPFQIRLLVMGGAGSTSGGSATGSQARAKNSTYVKVLYRVQANTTST